jgi:hypothetical protein
VFDEPVLDAVLASVRRERAAVVPTIVIAVSDVDTSSPLPIASATPLELAFIPGAVASLSSLRSFSSVREQLAA